jgi:hypothetical protein
LLQRVKFGTGSSVPPKVNFGAEWRRIPKSVVTAHVEVLEELSRVEWSHLCALANDAPASKMDYFYLCLRLLGTQAKKKIETLNPGCIEPCID